MAPAGASSDPTIGVARKLDVLLPLLATATAAQQQREEKRRREAGGDGEWEEEYVLCEFDDAELNLDGEILVQDLDTAAPRVTVDGQPYSGVYSEDVGSTLVFDSEQLQAVVDEAEHQGPIEQHAALTPLCVTTKRMRLQPALP